MSSTPSITLCEPKESFALKNGPRQSNRPHGIRFPIHSPAQSIYSNKTSHSQKTLRRSSKSSERLFVPSPSISTETFLHPKSAATSRENLLRFRSNPDFYRHAEDVPEDVPDTKDQKFARLVTGGLTLFTIVVLVLGSVIPIKCVVPLPINVLVPFYVYPDAGAWDRLHDAILNPRNLNFTVIINPHHGPGNTSLPSTEYIEQIKRLNIYPNVRTIGYVDFGLGLRSNKTVRNDVKIYAGWANTTGLALDGIYFDRTPAEFTNKTALHLKTVNEMVRLSKGFREPRLVVHNPGMIPNKTLDSGTADMTVVFEGTYDDLPTREDAKRELALLEGERGDYAYLVRSVPEEIGRGGLRRIVNGVRRNIEWLFVTDLSELAYEGYGSVWEEFLDLTF